MQPKLTVVPHYRPQKPPLAHSLTREPTHCGGNARRSGAESAHRFICCFVGVQWCEMVCREQPWLSQRLHYLSPAIT